MRTNITIVRTNGHGARHRFFFGSTRSQVVFLVLSFASSCAGTTETARRPTYAKDLHQLQLGTIDTAMVELSKNLMALDELFHGKGSPPKEAQPEVIALLASMEASAAALIESRAFSKHAGLEAHIETFRFDLQRARETASQQPPSFLLASSVSSFCLSCHVGSERASP
jgi:hypothetical protein